MTSPANSTKRFHPYALDVIAAVLLLAAGVFVGHYFRHDPAKSLDMVPNGSIRAKPGPWGDLYYTPFTIAAPDEVLEVRKMEEIGTHWLFKNTTREDLASFFRFTGMTPELCNAMIAPAVLHDTADGLDLTPTFDMLLSLSPDSRRQIFQRLVQYRENEPQITFLDKATMEERFEGSGVSQQTLDLFNKIGCDYGGYYVVSGLATMLSRVPSYEEKLHLVKALTRQKTMLFRLCVTPKTDTEALARYWGRGSYATDVRTMLQSVAKIQGGGSWIDILMVLPPLPSSELYFYPVVQDNPLNGPPVVRDCHWTSFNFFHDVPDPKLSNPENYLMELKTNYTLASGDPRYGDMVLFLKPDGSAIHSAIYLADDIVFTKNGPSPCYPWMLSTISDLKKMYSFFVPPGQELNVTYFRNKAF